MTRAWSTALLLVVLGCQRLEDFFVIHGPLPAGAELYATPPDYLRWWKWLEACSGKRRRMSDVIWYRVPGAEFDFRGYHGINGVYIAPDRIVMADAVVDDSLTVGHEMLHAIRRDRGGHDPVDFGQRCAGLVDYNPAAP